MPLFQKSASVRLPTQPVQLPGEQHRAGNAARRRIGRGGREIAPAVVEAGGRQIDVLAEAEVQHQLGGNRANRPGQ